MNKIFTHKLLATLLLALVSMGAMADTDIFTANYQPNGTFESDNVSVDFTKQSIVAKIDVSNCSQQTENILSIGNDLSTWTGGTSTQNIHIYYKKASRSVDVYYNTYAEVEKHLGITSTFEAQDYAGVGDINTIFVELNDKGLHINGTLQISATTLTDLLQLTSLKVGGKEGTNQESHATYNYVKVTAHDGEDLNTPDATPTEGGHYFIALASDHTKALYIATPYEGGNILMGDLCQHYDAFSWTLSKSQYSNSLLYNTIFTNDYAAYALAANLATATRPAASLAVREDVKGTKDDSQDLFLDGSNGTFKLCVYHSSSQQTVYLYYNETDGTIGSTTTKEQGTDFCFISSTPKEPETVLNLDETVQTNTTYLSKNVESDKTYTVNLKRTFGTSSIGKWNSFVVPFPISESQLKATFGDGVRLGAYVAVDETKLYFDTSKTSVEAGVPYIIYIPEDLGAMPTDGWQFTGIAGSSFSSDFKNLEAPRVTQSYDATGTSVTFTGSYDKTVAMNQGYVISQGKIYQLNKTTQLKGFRAYFEESSSNPGKINGWSDVATGETTAISSIEGLTPEQPFNVYSLGGQLLKSGATSTAQLPKGIYVVNGKKMVVK